MSKEEKAMKLLWENRVELEEMVKSGMVFKVKGDQGTYTIIADFLTGNIYCECRWSQINIDKPCSHIIAVKEFIRQNFPNALKKLLDRSDKNES